METNTLISCWAAVVLLAGWGGASRNQSGADVTQPETIILQKKAGQGDIHYLAIIGSGEIKGTAEISLIENGQAHRKETLSGPVRFEWKNDWYADRAEIRYEPKSVADGKMRLDYNFKD